MSAAAHKVVDHPTRSRSDGGVRDRIVYPLVDAGDYDAIYLRHTKALIYRAKKLVIWFKIIDAPYIGLEIPKFYNVEFTKNGWRVGTRSRLYRDFCRLYDEDPCRLDRIPLAWFRGRTTRIRAGTVIQERDGKEIPEKARYSVIRDLLEVL